MVRGQGAMEYLMSYGWAILMVMIIGVSIWQIGVFNMGSSSPTSSGFQAVKPMLASCMIGEDIVTVFNVPYPRDNYGGFACQFINAAGSEIHVKDADIKLDGNVCSQLAIGSDLFDLPWPGNTILCKACDATGSCGPIINCWGSPATTDFIPVPEGSSVILIMDNNAMLGWEMCQDMPAGESYLVDVDITYEIEIGGIIAIRHSAGKIRISAEGKRK